MYYCINISPLALLNSRSNERQLIFELVRMGRVDFHAHELGFFLAKGPTSGERLIRRYTKFDFPVDEGKVRLNPSRDKK